MVVVVGEGSFVVLTAALGVRGEESAPIEVGSSARGTADRGMMGMERVGFLVRPADPWWEGGMNVMKELYTGLIRGGLMLLTCGRMSLEERTTSQVLDADQDLPRVFLAISRRDRHSVDPEFLENSLLHLAHPCQSEVAQEELLDCVQIDCSSSLTLSAKCFRMD